MSIGRFKVWLAILCGSGTLIAEAASPAFQTLPPLPSDLPPIVTAPAPRPRITPFPPHRPVSNFTQRASSAGPRVSLGEDVLGWDAVSKEYTAQAGETTAHFDFAVTNISKQEVTINWVRPSCGCTIAKLPPTPWKLAPGESGKIEFNVDLRGKFGTVSKYASVDTSQGQKLLNFKIHIPVPGQPGVVDARARNMQLAMGDRQAVFRNACASCHAAPTAGKTGESLFQAGCAICHEAPNRATMVPDLRVAKTARDHDFWIAWITNGKPGTLMPAFAQSQGGPLNDQQIQSLADYLTEHFPSQPASAAATAVATP
jgi:mono/diheme cytochrome c family protein